MKQNKRAKLKPRIEMRKMAGNGPGILAPLTASPTSFFFSGGGCGRSRPLVMFMLIHSSEWILNPMRFTRSNDTIYCHKNIIEKY